MLQFGSSSSSSSTFLFFSALSANTAPTWSQRSYASQLTQETHSRAVVRRKKGQTVIHVEEVDYIQLQQPVIVQNLPTTHTNALKKHTHTLTRAQIHKCLMEPPKHTDRRTSTHNKHAKSELLVPIPTWRRSASPLQDLIPFLDAEEKQQDKEEVRWVDESRSRSKESLLIDRK